MDIKLETRSLKRFHGLLRLWDKTRNCTDITVIMPDARKQLTPGSAAVTMHNLLLDGKLVEAREEPIAENKRARIADTDIGIFFFTMEFIHS